MGKKFAAVSLAVITLWMTSAPAFAETLSMNSEALSTNALPELLLIAQGDDDGKKEKPEETFYFGEGEEKVWEQKEIELIRFQDNTGKATKLMEKIMGTTILCLGLTMGTWALFFYEERNTPQDIYTGAEKYDVLGYVPLSVEKKVYWPSVVAGTGLSAGSVYLLFFRH